MSQPRRVIIESPYRGRTARETERNIRYVRACMRDSLLRGEAPFASHALYTLDGVLNDADEAERERGMLAGFAWRPGAEATVAYGDIGVSGGMTRGIEHARELGQAIEYRWLGGAWEP